MANPYQAPTALDLPDQHWERLGAIARYQRWLNLAILANVGVFGAMFMLALLGLEQASQTIFGLGVLAVALASIAIVFLLGRALSGIVVALLSAVFMFVPCLSLLVMLALSMSATRKLKQAGIYVGLLGASPESVSKAMALAKTQRTPA